MSVSSCSRICSSSPSPSLPSPTFFSFSSLWFPLFPPGPGGFSLLCRGAQTSRGSSSRVERTIYRKGPRGEGGQGQGEQWGPHLEGILLSVPVGWLPFQQPLSAHGVGIRAPGTTAGGCGGSGGGQDAGWRLCCPLGLPQRPWWVLGGSSLVRVPLSSLFQTLPLAEGMCRGAEYWALGNMGSHPVWTQVTPGVAILHPSS